ncbi:OB-fold nucleic acid binding domain-containing protein [Actinocrispum sp. NPDC049592]|uniref:OB-fold nucleic acid binding domain-containing protein n=1 Tax=Actinocrispum sp. NPDC049592 TaxID=3154835 RepID=UPI0034483BEC
MRSLLLALVFALVAPALPAAAGQTLTIAKARALPLGSVVTVGGTVTTPSGAFESSFFDKGFGLQDGTAGIYVSAADDVHATPGRRASVTGTLKDSFGLLILVPTDVSLGRQGLPVFPRWTTTAGVSESTEGRLVLVAGRVTKAPASDLPYGYKFWINDGTGEVQIFVNTQTGIDVSRYHLGQALLVTGFSGQFDTSYEVLPRSPHDILG